MSFLKKAKDSAKFWYDYIVNGDDAGSYFLSTILSLLFIVFVFYPLLGASLSTDFPIVAIQSGSMEHDGSFDDWWNDFAYCEKVACTQGQFYNSIGISKSEFKEFDFANGFNTGDVMIVKGKDEYDLGDVIVFQTKDPTPIIHRIIEKRVVDGEVIYSTKGDHNAGSIFARTPYGTFIDELNIRPNQIYGKAVFVIPYVGWIKIWFFQIITNIWYTITAILLIGAYYWIKGKYFS